MSAGTLNIATPKKSFVNRLFSFKPPVPSQQKPRHAGKPSVRFDLSNLNVLLIAGIAGCAVYLGFSVISAAALLRKNIAPSLSVSDSTQKSFAPLRSSLKEETYYVEKAQQRSLFTRTAKKESVPQQSSGPSQAIIDATKDLRLVGISWSDDPDVMIEDTKNQATFFLKKGQLIENDVYVKDVMKDKVIVRYKEEELDLK